MSQGAAERRASGPRSIEGSWAEELERLAATSKVVADEFWAPADPRVRVFLTNGFQTDAQDGVPPRWSECLERALLCFSYNRPSAAYGPVHTQRELWDEAALNWAEHLAGTSQQREVLSFSLGTVVALLGTLRLDPSVPLPHRLAAIAPALNPDRELLTDYLQLKGHPAAVPLPVRQLCDEGFEDRALIRQRLSEAATNLVDAGTNLHAIIWKRDKLAPWTATEPWASAFTVVELDPPELQRYGDADDKRKRLVGHLKFMRCQAACEAARQIMVN